MTIETTKYVRRPLYVDAIQVTDENMEEVAEWCGGRVYKALDSDKWGNHIKVKVYRPMTDRQTKAFAGDWILASDNGFKVFTPNAFENSFELAEAKEVKSSVDPVDADTNGLGEDPAEENTERELSELEKRAQQVASEEAAWAAGVGQDPRQEQGDD